MGDQHFREGISRIAKGLLPGDGEDRIVKVPAHPAAGEKLPPGVPDGEGRPKALNGLFQRLRAVRRLRRGTEARLLGHWRGHQLLRQGIHLWNRDQPVQRSADQVVGVHGVGFGGIALPALADGGGIWRADGAGQPGQRGKAQRGTGKPGQQRKNAPDVFYRTHNLPPFPSYYPEAALTCLLPPRRGEKIIMIYTFFPTSIRSVSGTSLCLTVLGSKRRRL